MTKDNIKVWSEEQKILLAMTRTMDSSILRWDDSGMAWHGQDGESIRDLAAAHLIKRCINETDIKFQDLSARIAIEVGDADLLSQVLPRLDIQYCSCEAIVTRAVKSHDPRFYTIVRNFWKTIEPQGGREDREYISKTYHLQFCNAMEVALKEGTPEVLDVVYQEFCDELPDPMVSLRGSNWVLIAHIMKKYLVLPGKLAELTNALRVAKKDDLVVQATSIGFRPSIERDPYENIIDMVHEEDFQLMLQNVDKIRALPREAAYRLVNSGQYDRIEAIFKVITSIPLEKQETSQFLTGLYDKFHSLREQGKYQDLGEIFRLFKTYTPNINRPYYTLENYFSTAVENSDINAMETFFQSGLEYTGGVNLHGVPQLASPQVVQYLINNGHKTLAGSVIHEFLQFNRGSSNLEINEAKEKFYFKCIELNIIPKEIFETLLHCREYYMTPSIVEDMVLSERIDERALLVMQRVWPGYMTAKMMEYFLSKDKEHIMNYIKWQDWGKYFVEYKKIEVMQVLITAGYEVKPSERSAATKSKNEAMIALLSRKKVKKNRKE
jgi:hypothetical protein